MDPWWYYKISIDSFQKEVSTFHTLLMSRLNKKRNIIGRKHFNKVFTIQTVDYFISIYHWSEIYKNKYIKPITFQQLYNIYSYQYILSLCFFISKAKMTILDNIPDNY